MADAELLAGRYRFRRELGRGAVGRVILATDERSENAERAIKWVGPADEARLRWEFGLLGGISHPGIASVHDLLRIDRPGFGMPAGSVALVSDYAPGRPADVVARDARREPRALLALALRVGERIARALGALHARGLVHGDVKPSNIIVADDGAPRLIDLGLARAVGETGASGTPGYVAPELWHGERRPASDHYALGVTLEHLLRGAPESAESTRSVAAQLAHALAGPKAREPLPAWVPADLARLLATLAAPDPDSRPASALGIAASLAVIAREAGVDLGASAGIGAGADDAPMPSERAAAMRALPLVGQEQALRALCAALSEARACVVQGPPGAGRSRLVREAVRVVQQARVAAGRTVPTYRVVDTLPRDLPTHESVLHVSHADALDGEDVERFLRAVDVEGTRLALVLERTQPLAGAIAHVTLAPLDDDDVARLLGHALGTASPAAALVREATRASGGLAGRLCRLLEEGVLAGVDVSRPAALRAFGAEHAGVDAVPEHARELAERLAVAGGELAHEALAERDASAAQAAASLCAAGLARRLDDGRLALRADVAEATRARLGAARVRAIAAGLPDAALDARARGHVAIARGQTDRAAAHFAHEVTTLRARGEPESAARVAREALRLVGGAPGAAALRVALGDALRACGRYASAAEALAGARDATAQLCAAEVARLAGRGDDARAGAERVRKATDADAATRLGAREILARIELDAGHFAAALAQARDAAREAAPLAAPRAREVIALAQLALGERGPARAEALAALAAVRAPASDALGVDAGATTLARAAEARLTAVLAQIARADGDLHDAAHHFTRAFELADRAGELHAAASFLHNLGTQRFEYGEPGPAIAALRDAARRLALLGRDADLARVLYNLAYAAHVVGDDDVAAAAARQAAAAARRCHDATTLAFAECLAGEAADRRGDAAAVKHALAATDDLGALAPAERAMAHARRATLWLALDERDGANRELALASTAIAAGGDDDAHDAHIEHDVAASAVALARGANAEAREHAERAHARATRVGAFDTRLLALLACARAARATGDAPAAAARLADMRSLLDAAARTLGPAERARMRGVAAYRAAFEALPAAPGAQPPPPATDGRWRALAALGKRLAAEHRPARLWDLIVESAVELGGAERGYLVLRDATGALRVRAAHGLDRRAVAQEGLSRSIVQRVMGTGKPLTTVDAVADADLSGAASVHALALRSVCAVPLRVRGEIAGAIYLEDRLRPFAFGADEAALLSDLADLASIALDSAQLLRAERLAARRLAVMRARLARRVEAQAIELESLKRVSDGVALRFDGIVAHSGVMQRALRLVERVAASDLPVLIRGESGTGKELVARAIHRMSPRHDGPFVSENCGAIPETLLESALFGHVRGAFTGAERRRLGLFEIADGGSLFLDEIGEMSPAMQTRLLRVLEDGEVRPVGGEQTRKVDVRVFAATHRDLEAMVRDGRFREDLYYRLTVVAIPLPPLRERAEDIAPLVRHFVEKHAPGRRVSLDRRVMARFATHAWPGNVRQLENEIRRALVLADDSIGEEHLSPALGGPEADANTAYELRAQVDGLERRLIRQALAASGGNQTQAAKLLGVSRFGLQKMMRRLRTELRADA